MTFKTPLFIMSSWVPSASPRISSIWPTDYRSLCMIVRSRTEVLRMNRRAEPRVPQDKTFCQASQDRTKTNASPVRWLIHQLTRAMTRSATPMSLKARPFPTWTSNAFSNNKDKPYRRSKMLKNSHLSSRHHVPSNVSVLIIRTRTVTMAWSVVPWRKVPAQRV